MAEGMIQRLVSVNTVIMNIQSYIKAANYSTSGKTQRQRFGLVPFGYVDQFCLFVKV
jgi:hypothetical protein